MVHIILSRFGKNSAPYYRVAVADSRCPRDGRFIETIGSYDPRGKKGVLKKDRLEYWLKVGAQPSGRILNLLKAGLLV